MENLYNQVSSMTIAKKWGVILAVISIVIAMLTYILVDPSQSMSGSSLGLSCLGFIISVVILYLAINEHKKLQNGYLTVGQGFLSGLLTAVISAIIAAIFQIVYLSFINPGYFDKVKEEALRNIDDTGGGAETEMVTWIMDMFTSPIMLGVLTLLQGVFVGAIISIIIAAIINNKPRKV